MRLLGLVAAASCAMAMPALASEIVLYDSFNCTGGYRVLIDSEPDLDRVDFGNRAASVRVVAGVWTIYRDDNYQSNNGPSVILSLAGECANLGQGAYQNFPAGLMDSVQLGQAAPGPGAVIVLYDDPNLQGRYRVLTANTPDLDAVDFDNRLASFQVVAGAWRIFRDDGFAANNGPPIDAAGTVADIAALGFPRDRASSVMRLNVASDPVTPPPVAIVQCPAGSAGNGRSCVDCTGQGLLPASDGGSCVCPAGQQAVGSQLVNGIPVALCQRDLAVVTPPVDPDAFERPACSGSLVSVGSISGGGGCVPCPEGAAPNAGNTQCVCMQGFIQIGIEGTFGHPVCSPESGRQPAQPGVTPATFQVPAEQALAAAQAGRFRFTTLASQGQLPSSCRAGARSEGPGVAVGFYPLPHGGTCDTTVFGDRSLREGWSFVSWDVWRAANCDAFTAEIDRVQPQNPRSMEHRIWFSTGPTLVPGCLFIIETITLRGPAGADWRDAFR